MLFRLIVSTLAYTFSLKLILDRQKQSPFECGFSSKENSRAPISMRFFLVALIFLIFDVELVLLFPFFSLLTSSKGVIIVYWVILFLSVLTLGLILEWSLSILEWAN